MIGGDHHLRWLTGDKTHLFKHAQDPPQYKRVANAISYHIGKVLIGDSQTLPLADEDDLKYREAELRLHAPDHAHDRRHALRRLDLRWTTWEEEGWQGSSGAKAERPPEGRTEGRQEAAKMSDELLLKDDRENGCAE